MNLSREQILAEMGITPIWRLRASISQAQGREDHPFPEGLEPAPQAAAIPAHPLDPLAQPDVRQSPAQDISSREALIAKLDWDGLKTSTAACQSCGLCAQRQQAVLGVGDRDADWLFIGEGPGADEDAQGEPFVGQAGKLLDNMLAAIDLKRGNRVYIANAVKCRPPGNRTPAAAEMAACRPYLERQIALIKPRLIVLLGRAAVNAVLNDEHPLTALRGKRFDYQGIPVVVTYHPAYLLRNLPEKAKAWEDLVYARRLMRSLTAASDQDAIS